MRSLASLASRSAGPLAAFALAALVQTGCGAARQSTSGAPRAPAASAASGHDLVVQATSCWMGGLWSDALGETGADRLAGIERRCDALLREVDLTQRERARAEAEQLPPPAPDEAYFPLRAVERHVVDALADKVRARAERDPREAASARELVTLLYATADAARETIHARRAADAVKEDVASQPSVAARNVDKAAAAPKLRSGQALDRLFTLQCGRYTPEARAIGLLVALDRMEIARGLPKHLKVYAVDRAYADVFGVQAPPVDDDAPAPIRSGTWLAYLTDVAAAAGHPVPDARDPQNREPLAWTGVLEGFADRLRASSADFGADTPLGNVQRAIVARLDDEYRRERVVYEAHAPADR